jgi:hypothetical protein
MGKPRKPPQDQKPLQRKRHKPSEETAWEDSSPPANGVETERKKADPEAKLDAGIRKLIGTGTEDYTPEDWRSLREQLRLQILYPGKVVAFRDHHEGTGENRRLVHREVLGASRSLMAVNRCIKKLSAEESRGVCLVCIEPDEE